MAPSSKVEIVEVSPRDGLQNEPVHVSTADKLGLIASAVDAGVRRIEVASFVHPGRVPQMADAEAVVAGLPDRADCCYIGLVLNQRGAARAATRAGNQRGVDQLGAVVVASDSFGARNQGQTISESIKVAGGIIRFAKTEGMSGQATISVAFGCPFEGAVPHARVVEIAEKLAEYGPCEIALADTIGVAAPAEVRELIAAIREKLPEIPLRAHFHNTRGTGIANALAALEAGVATLDASIGGVGGCPFAPGATGNIATEDLLYALDRSRVKTGIDLAAIIAAAHRLEQILGRPAPSMLSKVPAYPRVRS